jgi:acylphosphatase
MKNGSAPCTKEATAVAKVSSTAAAACGPPDVARSAIVSGKVQRVFFRKFTKEKADALGLRGVVRNLPDGTVHIVAVGQVAKLQDFFDWCFSIGSPKSRPTGVVVSAEPASVIGLYSGFSIDRSTPDV